MWFRLLRLGLVAACLCCHLPAWAQSDAEAAFAQGQSRLDQGDLRGALQSYIKAVKSDRDNQQYLQQYLLVRRAITLQAALSDQHDPQQWEQTALALRRFYLSAGLHANALPLDQAMFKRFPSAETAVQLAETLLLLDDPQQATETLRRLDPKNVSTASQALLSVSLARQQLLEEAKQVRADLQVPSDADSGTLYLVARMHSAVGDAAGAVTALTRCYEAVPPSQLTPLKAHARDCPDFAALAPLPAFAQAMRTESKVPESQCSGGSSCSTCPLRGNCAQGEKQ